VSKSKHIDGMAADIKVKNVKPSEVAKYAETIGVLGIGLYETDKDGYFVHIDTRTSKGFWYGHAQAKRTTFGGNPPSNINPKVKAFQEAAIKDGFKSILKSGADGIWGSECEEVCKKATLYKTKFPWRLKNLTKFVQSELGIKADGKFGADTHSAVIDYQEKCGFTGKDIDGIVGTKTYKKITGVK
jgi:peptidoglycan hydrolase-like protein with peptidoglycan-binding domain